MNGGDIMKKKALSLALAAVPDSQLFTACGSSSTGTSAQPEGASEDPLRKQQPARPLKAKKLPQKAHPHRQPKQKWNPKEPLP